MIDNETLRERAARCLRLAERLQADAETLKRFGEELTEMAQRSGDVLAVHVNGVAIRSR